MEFQDIIYAKEEGIATITLNRPQTMNAMTPVMLEEVVAAIEDAKRDDAVKVLVVTGAGRAFCSGANPRLLTASPAGWDVPDQEAPPAVIIRQLRENMHRVPRILSEFDKPYIGSINGAAVGGGMDMASMCDIRIASDRARFSMGYVRMGTTPAMGGCYLLPRIVGLAKACELIWTGRTIEAQEALGIGYVNQVVPHEELPVVTKELATQLAKGPSVAIQLAKRLIYRGLEMNLDTAFEAAEHAMLIAQSTEDATEGPRAWVEKREPRFKGK